MLDVHMYACSTYGGTDIQGWYKDRSVKSQTREGGSPPHTPLPLPLVPTLVYSIAAWSRLSFATPARWEQGQGQGQGRMGKGTLLGRRGGCGIHSKKSSRWPTR